jgi:ABC-type sugar transport system substrate-binding protein
MTRYPLVAAALAGAAALAPAVPAAAEPEPICIYPYDGGWCTPTTADVKRAVRDALPTVTEYCIYPYDGSICVPWIEQ